MSPVPEEVLAHPSVQRLKRVAHALGELSQQVVFIGGAVSPLLQADPPFEQARVTKDVDGVIATSNYTAAAEVERRLAERGFKQVNNAGHMHKWASPSGDILDLVPPGQHLGASGQQWDEYAAESCWQADLRNGVLANYSSAPAFLALKWAAFRDRGARDPGRSHDLEDIIAVVASRPEIVTEVRNSRADVAAFIAEQVRAFLALDRSEDFLYGCLSHVQDPAYTVEQTLARLKELA